MLTSSLCLLLRRSLFEGDGAHPEMPAAAVQPAGSVPVPGRRASVAGPRSPSVQVGVFVQLQRWTQLCASCWPCVQLGSQQCGASAGALIRCLITAPLNAQRRWCRVMWPRPTSRHCCWTPRTSSQRARVRNRLPTCRALMNWRLLLFHTASLLAQLSRPTPAFSTRPNHPASHLPASRPTCRPQSAPWPTPPCSSPLRPGRCGAARCSSYPTSTAKPLER